MLRNFVRHPCSYVVHTLHYVKVTPKKYFFQPQLENQLATFSFLFVACPYARRALANRIMRRRPPMAIHSRSLGCKKWERKRFPKSGEMGGRGKRTSVGGGKREKRLLFFSYTRYYQVVYQPKKTLNGEQGGRTGVHLYGM